MKRTFSIEEIAQLVGRVASGEIDWDDDITDLPPIVSADSNLDYLGDNYVIAWTSNLTGYQGCCTTAFRHSVAMKIAAKADKEFPEISHNVLPKLAMRHGRLVDRATV